MKLLAKAGIVVGENMPLNMLRQDLRSYKTKKSLSNAMYVLLHKNNFRKVTTKDICNEALISRATFYSHFVDKYDLLKYWLINLQRDQINKSSGYDVLEKSVNQFIAQHKTIIKNVLENADSETVHIVRDIIIQALGLNNGKNNNDRMHPKYVVYSNIFAGGIMYYLLWHVENRFPLEVMNTYLYDLVKKFRSWESQ